MFKLGQKESLTKTFSEEDVIRFSKMSQDVNPIHFDVEYAEKSRFKKRIVQGPFVASLFGGILGGLLPGPGTIYLQQTTNFLKPVFIGEKVIVNVEIVHIRQDKPIIKLRTWVENEENIVVVDGEATILFLSV